MNTKFKIEELEQRFEFCTICKTGADTTTTDTTDGNTTTGTVNTTGANTTYTPGTDPEDLNGKQVNWGNWWEYIITPWTGAQNYYIKF